MIRIIVTSANPNIPVTYLIAGCRNMIKLSKNMSS